MSKPSSDGLRPGQRTLRAWLLMQDGRPRTLTGLASALGCSLQAAERVLLSIELEAGDRLEQWREGCSRVCRLKTDDARRCAQQ